ncbi:SDR family NAD(P)-dependent oxidoreductase [Rhodococcus erythropolis]
MTAFTDLRGRLAIVTGAGSGIGEALAQSASDRGMAVLAIDVNADRLDQLVDKVSKSGGSIDAAVASVADSEGIAKVAADAEAQHGPAGLIVNNAGVEFTGRVWETDATDWRKLLDINVNGVFNVTRAFLPGLLASGQSGHVVMLSSVGGLTIGARQSAYIVSKYAVRVLAQCLRADLDETNANVGVTVVLPGPVRTNIFADASAADATSDTYRKQMSANLARDGLEPAEVARMTYAAVESGEFWVHSHPDMSRYAVERQHLEFMSAL